MNFRHYQAIYWIGRLGSFHAAARHLRTSQAAISGRVHKLEQELGGSLFRREHDGVRLSPLGTRLMPYAARLMELDAEVRQLAGPGALTGHVRLGATGVHALTWIPELIRRVARETPGITVECAIETSETLHRMLEQRRLDLAILAGDGGEPLGAIENIWVAAPGLAVPSPCSANDLARYPIISDRPGTRLHTAVLAWFRAEGTEPALHHSASHLQARLALALAGVGVAVAARAAAMPAVRAGSLRLVDTGRDAPSLSYVLAVADEPPPDAAARVADLVRQLIHAKPDFDTLFAAAVIAGR